MPFVLFARSSLIAQATNPRSVLDSTLTAHAGDLVRLRLGSGAVLQFDSGRQRGEVQAILEAMRGDTLFLQSRDKGSGQVLIADVRALAIRTPRSHEEGFQHSAVNGAIIGATLGLSFKLLDNLLATDTEGKRLHSTTEGLLSIEGVVSNGLAPAILIAVPSGLIGLALPGKVWRSVRLR